VSCEGQFTIPSLNNLVIYELHIGTFGLEDENRPGTIRKAIEWLPYLAELGINAIEIMPVSEFPGGYSWGYNPSLIFSIESDYGTPADFCELTQKAHELGITVILDVVYNHLGPSDLDLWRFDGWHENDKGGIYFYNDWRSETPWGDTRPDYGRGEVREYIRDNALFWLTEYGVDGLRWDATLYIRNVHGRNNDSGSDLPDAWSLMQSINAEIQEKKPGAITIAEDLQNNPFMTRPTGEGGAGFLSQWDALFVHTIRDVLTLTDDASRDLEKVRNALQNRYDIDSFKRVIYTESHDEVANGKARMPEEIAPDDPAGWFAKRRSALGAALVFTAPGVPMIFQGQEFLEDDWFSDQRPLDWAKREHFAGIRRLYSDLIALRLNREGVTAGLTGQEIQVYHLNQGAKMIAYHRCMKGGPGDSVVVVANFGHEARGDYQIGLPHGGVWQVRLNGDAKVYDPSFTDTLMTEVPAEEAEYDGLPFSGRVTVAPYSFLILSGEA
jgi:1,4-alpha-glucan branching enzyme